MRPTTSLHPGGRWSWDEVTPLCDEMSADQCAAYIRELVRRVNQRLPGMAEWEPHTSEIYYVVGDTEVTDSDLDLDRIREEEESLLWQEWCEGKLDLD